MVKITLLLLILLTSCSSHPVLKPVKPSEALAPKSFIVFGTQMSYKAIQSICPKGTYGCIKNPADNVYRIYYTDKVVLKHELEHLPGDYTHYGD